MRAALLIALVACTTSEEDPAAFAFLGPVDGVLRSGSTIGLWEVRTPEPLTYKFGDGRASPIQFDLGFRADPPEEALENGAFGVGFVAMLPGLATAPEGEVQPENFAIIGGSTDTAVIFKTPGASGPAWLDAFPDGYSCALCLREQQPDGFAPVDCTFVTIEPTVQNRCTW